MLSPFQRLAYEQAECFTLATVAGCDLQPHLEATDMPALLSTQLATPCNAQMSNDVNKMARYSSEWWAEWCACKRGMINM